MTVLNSLQHGVFMQQLVINAHETRPCIVLRAKEEILLIILKKNHLSVLSCWTLRRYPTIKVQVGINVQLRFKSIV